MLRNIIGRFPLPYPPFPFTILKTIVTVVKWVYNNFFKYDSKTATIDDTKKINEILENCINHYKPEAKKFDEILMNYADRQISEIIKILKEVNKEYEIINEYIFLQLEYQKNITLSTLKNAHSKKIDNIFSLNNNELLDILKLENDRLREDSLNKLVLEGLEKANIDSINELEEILKCQEKIVSKEIEKNNSLFEEQLNGELKEIEKIQNAIKDNREDLLKKKVIYNLILTKLEKLKMK